MFVGIFNLAILSYSQNLRKIDACEKLFYSNRQYVKVVIRGWLWRAGNAEERPRAWKGDGTI